MPKVKEYKDQSNEWRMQVISNNNEVIDNTHEGYKNRVDMVDSKLKAAIAILEKYKSRLDIQQLGKLHGIVFNEDELE